MTAPIPATATEKAARRDYSAFDAELTGQALNLKLFMRLLGWVRPYGGAMAASLTSIVIASTVSVLQPVVIGRVVIDTILLPNPKSASLPSYGMIELTAALARTFATPPLVAATLVWTLVTLIAAIAMYVHRLTLGRAVLQALRDLRVDLFTKLEDKPASFYDHVAVGRVMTRVTNDIENLHDMLTSVGLLAGEFVPFFLALFLMWSISPSLTGVVLLVLPAVAVATYVFRRAMSDVFRRIRNSISNLNQYLQETLVGLTVVQISGRETRNEAAFAKLNDDNRSSEFKAINVELVFWAFNYNLSYVAIACILYFGAGDVVQDRVSLGSVVLFTQLIGMMINPIVMLSEQFNQLFRAMASGERIFQAIDWDERVHEPAHPVQLPPRSRGEVEFRHLTFGYYTCEHVLEDVSVRVEAGRKLAIVGPTGSGKSTMIRLLARFYDFPDGMLFLDGIDVNRVATRALRKRIGVVPQDFHIFSGTVLDNLTLNDPDVSADRAIAAARRVHAHAFIMQLPDGYDTYLSERGQNLSQGQRQLLALARVLAIDPEILILDEATANIDTTTELLIQEALHTVLAGRTAIVIAHRLQTIQDCDHVLVLHHGRMREYGTHEELLALRGLYYALHELQFQDGALAEGDAV